MIATIEGQKMTAGDFEHLVGTLPPQMQQNANRDRKAFLQQWALLKHISNLAEKANLHQQTPYKERIEHARMQLLANAQLDEVSKEIPVSAEEQQKFYQANKERYTQAKIKVIYLPYSTTSSPQPSTDPKAKKPLTETEAEAKAADVVKQLRAGADFVKMVREHSEDPTSKEKDGDFGQPIRRSDSLPDAIHNAIFALKPGEITDPVKQPNGYYIFRLEELVVQTYSEVKDDIFKELKSNGFKQWFEAQQKKVDIKFENEAFFSAQPEKR